ncbi:MAG: chorismate synthase [candidate division Zixibacteria bacterium]|nr:chorismate synthase [candidate division Zixibacteria bacterium]
MGLEFYSAGESHGPQLTGFLQGLPSGLRIDLEQINADLAERQKGYGRGGRMKIEQDRCRITAGVRHGVTLGSPISFVIENRDWANWQSAMSVTDERPEPSSEREAELSKPRTVPRPGHADLAGAQKYNHGDLRSILERASARETAVRVAAAGFAKLFLREFGVETACHVIRIGGAVLPEHDTTVDEIRSRTAESDVRCIDPGVSEAMRAEIKAAAAAGDTLGGVIEIVASGVVAGLGDHIQWSRKLDGQLARAVMSVPSIKGVEIGDGFAQATRRGSTVHDEILYEGNNPNSGFYRRTNRAGGLEGGLTNGADIIVRAAAKPISTLNRPLQSVDIHSKTNAAAFVERSDVCSVPAAAVVCEAMVAVTLADTYLRAFGHGALRDLIARFRDYTARLDTFGA